MKRSLDCESIRTPTPTWAGLGLSRTSPFPVETIRNDWERNNSSPYNLPSTSGMSIVDPAPSSKMFLNHHKDIRSLLSHLGLEHYMNTFEIHEIDLDVFATLTPDNLTTLGIQAFGARKKLLMAINQLNESNARMNRSTKFSGSAAPGAERRSSGNW